MWMYVCGDNERTYYLREIASARGHRITCPDDAQVVVLPLPVSAVSEALKSHLHRGQRMICGLTDDVLRREAKGCGWKLEHIYEDERYQQLNALDSAEGAVYALMREAPFALRGKRCLIVGYGRLGKALDEYLTALGIEVHVAARSEAARRRAGVRSMDIGQALEQIGGYEMIVNTVPAQIIGKSALDRIQAGALLMDTASAPYGFSLEEAKHKRIHAWRENGIPGRYCPRTAAERLLDLIERKCAV